MRDPAIHIRRSDLIRLTLSYGLTEHDINIIMQNAVKCSIRSRVVVAANAKGRKKLERVSSTEVDVIDEFNLIYKAVMLEYHIKTITIRKHDAQYELLKEIVTQAKEFCELFSLEYKDGFRLYVESGVKLLGDKYSIYRLKGYANKIVEYYKDLLIISNDPTPTLTVKMFEAWQQAVDKYFGSKIDTGKNITVFAHFVHAKNDAEAVKAKYINWMYAQFEKWQYLNSVPEFSQLHGENAKLIYNMYMAKGHQEFKNKEEEKYFNSVKNEKEIPLKASEHQKVQRKTSI